MTTGSHEEAGDFDEVEEAREQAELRDRQLRADFDELMNMPVFRRWMWNHLGECRVHQMSFSTDALVMALNEGRRDVGNRLVTQIMDQCPEKYVAMQMENVMPQEKA